MLRSSALSSLALLACSSAADRSSNTTGGSGAAATGSDASSVSDDGGVSSDSEPSDSGATRFDVGAVDGDTDGSARCTAIDVLVVVDNTATMAEAQRKLIPGMSAFVAALAERLPLLAAGMHVGVTKTDAYGPVEPTADPPDGCAVQLGGLIQRSTRDDEPTGFGLPCELGGPPNARYTIVGSDLDEFERRFACTATVGTGGDERQRPAEAVLTALSEDRLTCNGGFLRADALLVVLIVTDEDDQASAPHLDPAADVVDWIGRLGAIKDGGPDEVVLLLLSGGWPPFSTCGEGGTIAQGSPKLTAWAQGMTFHTLGDLCGADYEGFFLDAHDRVLEACGAGVDP